MSGGEYIQLKWNSHQAAFLSNLSSLRDKQVLTDVMISCEEQFYPAHRLVLSSCSTYFSRALELTTCQQPVVMLYGIKEATLEHLLMYMYDGQVTITRALLPELLRAGRWLGVKGLEDTGDLPPNLTDDTSASQGPQTVSHMAHLVTQIFSSMASSVGVDSCSSVDDLTSALVRACEKGSKADRQLCVSQQTNYATMSDLTQTTDALDSAPPSLLAPSLRPTDSEPRSSPGISRGEFDTQPAPDQTHDIADQISSSPGFVELRDTLTFMPKVSRVSSRSAPDEVRELETPEAEYSTELQMEDIEDQQDIKMVPNTFHGFELEGREENTVTIEQLVRGEEPQEVAVSASSEQLTQLPAAEEGPATNSNDLQILARIELQSHGVINVTNDTEVDGGGRLSPCLSESSESYSFEGWEEGYPDEAAVTANLKALQTLITEALHYREHHRASDHYNESNIVVSPRKIDERNILKCKECPQKFKLHIELKQHMRRVHNKEIVCEVCSKSFKHKSSYARHKKVHSIVDGSNIRQNNNRRAATTKITSIAVEDLAIRTPRRSALHHTLIHHSTLKIGSVVSPLSLSVKKEGEVVPDNKVRMRQHKPTKHNSHIYTCAICSKSFTGVSKETFLAHVRKHRKKTVSSIKSKTTKYFKCPYCPFKGEHKRMVNGHMRVHSSDLPFRCHKCLFRSSTEPTLTTHINEKHPELLSQKQS